MAIANFSEFFSLKLISTRSNAVIPRASTTSFASGVKSTPKIVKTDTTMVAQDDNSFIPKFLSSIQIGRGCHHTSRLAVQANGPLNVVRYFRYNNPQIFSG